jgi:Zinc dependent phospholipase C
MPKELTHWMIARQAARRLDATSRTSQAVRSCPEAFYLGAIAPDGPYYVPNDASVVDIATRLHGQGTDDAYAAVKRAIATAPVPGPSPSTIAFAAGVLCHMAADTVFHPAVFYFTGFAAHPSAAVNDAYLFRHRAFETALDVHLLREHSDGLQRRLSVLLAQATARPDGAALVAALARYYATAGQPLSGGVALGILVRAGRTQRLFFWSALRFLLRLRHCRHAGKNADVSALFYSRRDRWSAHFTAPRPYRDPVSGAQAVFDVPAFFDKAVAQTSLLVGHLERALAGHVDAFPMPGPSLETGHPLDQAQAMWHCDPALTEA